MQDPANWLLVVRDRFLRWAGPVLAVLLVVAGLSVMVLWRAQQVQIMSVQSDSMAPVLQKGDAVVVQRTTSESIGVGDMVSYASPADPMMVITHRVVAVDRARGRLVTKGDANMTVDPAVSAHEVLGRVQYAVPGLGYVIEALRSWSGLVVAVYLPAAVLLVGEFVRVGRYYLRPTYVLRGR